MFFFCIFYVFVERGKSQRTREISQWTFCFYNRLGFLLFNFIFANFNLFSIRYDFDSVWRTLDDFYEFDVDFLAGQTQNDAVLKW